MRRFTLLAFAFIVLSMPCQAQHLFYGLNLPDTVHLTDSYLNPVPISLTWTGTGWSGADASGIMYSLSIGADGLPVINVGIVPTIFYAPAFRVRSIPGQALVLGGPPPLSGPIVSIYGWPVWPLPPNPPPPVILTVGP